MTTHTEAVRALAEHFPEPTLLVGVDGEIRFANRAFARAAGRSPAELQDARLSDVVDSGSRPLGEYLRLCARSRELVPGTVRLSGRTGPEAFRAEGALVSTDDEDRGTILIRLWPKTASSARFVALNEKLAELNQQVSRRVEAEKLLRWQKEWLHGTLSSIGEGLIATDAQGRIQLMNEVAEQLTGWTSRDALGFHVGEVFYTFDEATGEQGPSSVMQALEGGGVVRRHGVILRARDGTRRPIHKTASPIRDESGNAAGVVLVFRDVTRERRAAEETERAKNAAEAANRAKSEFLASVSHELRTPMNVVIGMTDLALESDLAREVRDYLSTARLSANNLLHLLDELLDLSKIEAGGLELNERSFRLRSVLYEVVQMLAVEVTEKRLELTCRVDPEVPGRVVGDASRLRQILINLVNNAIKFTEEGEVSLEVDVSFPRPGHASVHFAVRDTGIGVSTADRSRIFLPFVQADSSMHRLFTGSGLGLSIVSFLLDRMGGKLWVESELGEGSTFHFTLEYPVEERFDPGREAGRLPPELRGAPVLVVDAHPSSRSIVARVLSEWGMEPAAPPSTEEAVRLVSEAEGRARPFALAVVDGAAFDAEATTFLARLKKSRTRVVLTRTPVSLRGSVHRPDPLPFDAAADRPVTPPNLMAALNRAWGVEADARDDEDDDSPPRSRSLDVLLAEDTEANEKLLVALLRRAGHRVEVARNGQEAVALHARGSFDAIVMDVQMPRMDGFEATKLIREAEAESGARTPIVALSAHAMVGFRERCLDAGMDDYMAKPFTGAELHECLMAVTSDGLEKRRKRRGPTRVTPAGEGSDLASGSADDDLLESFRGEFVRDFGEILERIRASVDGSDARALEQAAHSLRGSSAFLGVASVTEAAASLEAMGRAGAVEGADELVGTLRRALERMRREVREAKDA